MATPEEALRKYAPFINGIIMQLYGELGFSITLKSGKTGLRIVSKSKAPFWGGEVLVDTEINKRLTELGFAKFGLWSVLSELDFLRKNTTEENFGAKLKEYLESGKVSKETYEKGTIDGRASTMEALSAARKMARDRKVAYVLAGKNPIETYVHEKLHEVCEKISKIKHGSRVEHDYIEVVVPYILLRLMEKANSELKALINEELSWYLTTDHLAKDGWPKQIDKIMKLYYKKKIKKEDSEELIRSVTYEQLMVAMNNIIKKRS